MQTASTSPDVPSAIHIAPWVEKLLKHPLYGELSDEFSLRIFMRAHVFAVWDFQSLLKALQRNVTCVEVPWFPTADPLARRFVNEIVLDEESDETPEGSYLSHFELYLQAMQACGADTTAPIRGFLSDLREGHPLVEALARPEVPRGVAPFVSATLAVATSGKAHCIAAAFAYGREEVIPGMFLRVVDGLAAMAPQRWATFRYYLQRHIGTDADRHAPQAKALVARLCGTDATLWAEAEAAARSGLESRLQLWNAILETLHAERLAGRDAHLCSETP